jgi:cytochrome c-type protein NapB
MNGAMNMYRILLIVIMGAAVGCSNQVQASAPAPATEPPALETTSAPPSPEAPVAGPAEETETAGIPEKDIGLSKVNMTETAEPLLFNITSDETGESPLRERYWEGAPPTIPHTLEDMLPITFSENECIECHQVDTKEEGEATPIPESHFVDIRNAPDTKREIVAGARFLCISCHAMQSDAQPLVENTFEP